MTIIERYVAKSVLGAIGLVTVLLIGLQLFMLFVDQLGDMGRGDYGIVQTGVFVLLQMPYQVYLFFPIASLLGCLIGLGVLANHSELVVMRGVGLSIGQITWAIIKAASVLILLVTILGETLIPKLTHYSYDYKAYAVSGGQSLRTTNGMWSRFGNDFVFIGTVVSDTELSQMYQFHFDDAHHMQYSRLIAKAKYEGDGWMAYDVAQTDFFDDHTKASHIKRMPWDIPVKPKILKISSHEPDEMTLRELNRYIREQKKSQMNVQGYQLTFYQRLVQPLSTIVMMILAIPFIFGPLRSSTMGSKLLVGVTVGFGFHMLNHFLGPLSTVYQLPPELAAFGPTLVFALVGVYLMRRVH